MAAAVYGLLGEGRKDLVLALSTPLLDWSSGGANEPSPELVDAAARPAAVEVRAASAGNRRLVRVGSGLAEGVAAVRRRLRI